MKKPLNFVITAGPTREFIDPVRFLSNPSTGKMGFSIARAAAKLGHKVTLIAGPVALKTPSGVERVDVVSAREMFNAAKEAVSTDCIFIATAAVADWRPKTCATKKLKKTEMSDVIKLVRNPDILKSISGCVKIGFAAETNDVLEEATRKCREKNLAMIVANDVTEEGAGFGTDTNRVVFIYPDGRTMPLKKMSKLAVARRIVRECENICS
ncbi:MAG: bifunctional phosphopantothenoylcysteine decarboxylase/phosphopantothenate--cysteine ligase CoaBC [Kiritimatiellae bacterium]|nr:bifunctional phosphopantothenoylcysteine decarboxylase/phosphopantothenate--cysteine ligase CoaBC [Kiritimatiellia bacterium]